jgi:hypothetical protein
MSENEQEKMPTVAGVCGNCLHWLIVEQRGPMIAIGAPKRGECWGVPPTPQSIIGNDGRPGAVFNMRAQTRHNERGCALFMPCQEAIAELAAEQNARKVPGGT